MTVVARFANEVSQWGFVEDGKVYPADHDVALRDLLADPGEMAEIARTKTESFAIEEVSLLAPIPHPPQFLGVGLNYRDHAAESGMDVPLAPVTFGFLQTAIIGDGETVRLPPFTDEVDWEAELAIVIGKRGADISESEALDYVAGYTVINDVSARDVQMAEGQWSRAKSFDTFKPMGPWIAATDEIGDASGLGVSLWVNDELKQSSNTSELIFDVPQLVSRLSRSTTLLPGAVIATGTPHGVGFSRTPPEFLRDGDVVTIEIEGIGRLTNPVAKVERPG